MEERTSKKEELVSALLAAMGVEIAKMVVENYKSRTKIEGEKKEKQRKKRITKKKLEIKPRFKEFS